MAKALGREPGLAGPEAVPQSRPSKQARSAPQRRLRDNLGVPPDCAGARRRPVRVLSVVWDLDGTLLASEFRSWWRGRARLAQFGALAIGIYPFVVLFPMRAANGGEPSQPAIASWGLATIRVGYRRRSTRHTVPIGIRNRR